MEALTASDIRRNCEKASRILLNWASSDALNDALRSLGHNGDIWYYLAKNEDKLTAIANVLPRTVVPSVKQARAQSLDREGLKARRDEEDTKYYNEVEQNRLALAHAICNGYERLAQNALLGACGQTSTEFSCARSAMGTGRMREVRGNFLQQPDCSPCFADPPRKNTARLLITTPCRLGILSVAGCQCGG